MFRQLLRSSFFLTASRLAGMAVGVFLTPFILLHLGLELMGLYGLLAGMVAYFALLDFGTSAAGMRFLTEFVSRNEKENARRLYATLNTISLAIGLLGILFAWQVAPLMLPLLKIPDSLEPLARFALIYVGFTFYLTLFKQQIYSLLNAHNHFSVPATLDLAGTLVYAAAMFLLLSHYSAFTVLVYGLFGQALLQIIFLLCYGWTVGMPPGNFLCFGFDTTQFLKIFSFSRNIWVSNISTIVVFESQKLFLGAFVSLEAVAVYYLCARLTSVQRAFGTGFAAPLTRHATKLWTMGDTAGFREQFRKALILFSWGQFVVLAFLFANASDLLTLWLGKSTPAHAEFLLKILAVGMFFTLLTAVPNCFARSAGITGIEVWAAGASIIASLALNFALIPAFDIAGAAWANMLTLVCGATFYAIILSRALPALRSTGVFTPLVKCTAAAGLLIASILVVSHFVPQLGSPGRISAFIRLAEVNVIPVVLAALFSFWIVRMTKPRAS